MTKSSKGRLAADVLVFDLDGTLVDSAPDLATALNALLRERGAAPLSLPEVRSMIGDGAGVLVARGLAARGLEGDGLEGGGDPAIQADALARFLDLYDACLIDSTRAYPEVPETLTELARRGFRMAVCTNKPFGPSTRILEALDLNRFFTVVIGGDTLPARKPAPEPLLAAIARLGGTIGRAAMIGDSANDMICARAANVAGILIPSGYGAAASGADLTLTRFADLSDAFISR